MSFKLGSVRATPTVASAAGRVPGVIAGRSKVPADFTVSMTDDSIADLTCLFKKQIPDSQLESMVDIVSKKELADMRGDKTPFAKTFWTPPLVVTRSVLHGVGVQKSKFPEQNVASRFYFFKCSTAVPDGLVAKINGDNHQSRPGFDLKADHRFYNDQSAKILTKITQELWENPTFAKSWRESRIDILVKTRNETLRNEYEKQRAEGKITAKELQAKLKPLDAKTTKFSNMNSEEQKVILDQLFIEFRRALNVPMHEDDEAPPPPEQGDDDEELPKEFAFDFKIKIFKKPRGVLTKLPAVPPTDVEKEFARLVKEREAEYAAAGKTLIMDERIQKELTARATKSLCEAAGYKYNQIEFWDKSGKPPTLKSPDFLISMCYSGFIVRVGYSIAAYATKDKFGIRYIGRNKIQILQPVKPTRIDDGPEESDFGTEFSFESICALVGRTQGKEEPAEPVPAPVPVPVVAVPQKRKAVTQPTVVTVQPAAKRQKTGQNGSGVSAAQGRVRKAAPAPEPAPEPEPEQEPIDEGEYSDHELQAMEQDGGSGDGDGSEGEYTDEE